ncbi:MAG: ribosome assembly cofactor RimP [Bacteroidota bacterium]|nr:ribosome assembly cofactor RimP [Bacteroidota bacterium]
MLPLFFGMNLSNKVKYFLEKVLEEKPDLFLIKIDVRGNNSVKIIVDGDNGIKVKDCVEISKRIKNQINNEYEDFSIEVSSPGVGEDLKISRQYINNVGRDLEIRLEDGTFLDGKLKNVNKESIELEMLVNKSIKKREKVYQSVRKIFNYREIKQARVKLKY